MLTVRRLSWQAEIPRWKIAEGEHDFVSEEHSAAEQPDFRHSTKASDRDRLVLHTLKLAGMKFDFLLQHKRDVPAIDRTRKKVARFDVHFMVEPRPAQKVVGIVGIGAHIFRRDIQQVLRAGRTVSDAPAQMRASLHQHNGHARARLA
jgi:hypothetical protein